MLNIPLIPEIVAVRVVVTDKYVAGWIDRTVLNPFPLPINNGCTPTPFYGCARGNVLAAPIAQNFLDVNWERLKNGRISLRFKPSDALDVNLTAMYQKIETGGYSQVDLPPAGLSWPETHYQPFNQPEPYNDEFKSVALNATYNWETLQFTSSSGYWTRDLVQSQDINEAIQATYSLPNFIPGNATNEADSLRQISQEFHLASTGKDRFQWLVGAFYSHLDSAWGQSTLDPALAGYSVGGAAANPAGVVYVSSTNYLFKQSAAFSEVSYELIPKLKLTGGLRYFSYDTDLATTQSGLYAQSANATPTYSEVKATSHGFNPKYNAAYTLTDDAMVYATVAKGFRPGGSNLPLPIIGPNSCLASFQALGLNGSQTSYGSDSVWSYELGEKTKLDSGRIVINGDIYYTKWNSVQQLLPLTCGWWFTANAGDARSYGPELEVTARITSAITLSVNGAYTEAQITTPGAHTNLQAGAPLLNIPKYTANVVASYTTPMTSNWDFTARATEAFTGPMEDIAYYRAGLPAYRMASIRTGMTSDRINVYAFVDNVANKEALLTINNTGIGINMPSLTRATVTQPRTIGIDVHVKF
jgi:outer membrane receptor protein involved in Fe transport